VEREAIALLALEVHTAGAVVLRCRATDREYETEPDVSKDLAIYALRDVPAGADELLDVDAAVASASWVGLANPTEPRRLGSTGTAASKSPRAGPPAPLGHGPIDAPFWGVNPQDADFRSTPNDS
jgi:hypothetical protein